MKKAFVALFLLLAMTGMIFANGSSEETAKSGEREEITFWYRHKGDEAIAVENIIATYNASQDKYHVTGLSANDAQKVLVAVSSGTGPDVYEVASAQFPTFVAQGLLESLDDYVKKDNIDVDNIFVEKAALAGTANGVRYSLPLAAYNIELFYNKDLLAEAGYTEPPKTIEEMYEMAVKATKLDSEGNIEVLGYPLFPFLSAKWELTYAWGGRWWNEDRTEYTPENPGNLLALEKNVEYRNLYGIKKVQAFISTANTNRYTEKDMFFQGKQLFRIDGAWLPTMMKNYNLDVNWGVCLVPGQEGSESGVSRYDVNHVAIMSTSKHKEGAWDFCKWLATGAGAKAWDMMLVNPPALKENFNDADIQNSINGFEVFMEASEAGVGINYPIVPNYTEYASLIDEYLDYAYSGDKTPQEAINGLIEATKRLTK